jgi:hypothetical protein
MSTDASNNVTNLDYSSSNNGANMRNYLNNQAEILLKNKGNQDTNNHDNEGRYDEIISNIDAFLKINLIYIKV